MSEADFGQVLTQGGVRLAELALKKQRDLGHASLGVSHWLLALLEYHATMARAIVPELDPGLVKRGVQEQLARGDIGAVMDLQSTIDAAFARARGRGRSQANERDLAAVILKTAGYKTNEGITTIAFSMPEDGDHTGGEPLAAHTPYLDQFGRDLTAAAREGKLCCVVGREAETDLVIETLCRRTKRNPVLVGPAGVGKTAIVEGLALRIVAGKVPAVLANHRLIALQPSTLVAGANMAGELEKRMKAILQEASQEGILLFIDEIHTIMGAGGVMGTTDVGSMLKPALARGDIACIAATTDEEYRRWIESDSALERRFQPIRIHELSPDQTLEVLRALRTELMSENSVCVDDEILRWLIEFAQQYMRNRHFPDKAVDLLEQVYAHAVAAEKNCVDMADAQNVAERMVGMPLTSTERLTELENALRSRRLFTDVEIHELISRLQVTMRGMDMHTSRPNAIVLLAGEASENGEAIAELIAQVLFGEKERVISIDFSRFGQPEDISLLLGSPPGYVGYNDPIPLHRLIQIPWCVLFFDQIDLCHPRIREVVAQALLDGWIMDGRGKTIYLSDAIVILTSGFSLQSHRGFGFTPENEPLTSEDVFQAVASRIGDNLTERVDLFAFGLANEQGVSIDWLKNSFLAGLSSRFLKQGVRLMWDQTLIEWMASHQQANQLTEQEWETWVDRSLAPTIIPHLPALRLSTAKDLLVKVEDNRLVIGQL